jgi:hypothetical protein
MGSVRQLINQGVHGMASMAFAGLLYPEDRATGHEMR